MAKFKYEARSINAKRFAGRLDAFDEGDAAARLADMSLFPVSVERVVEKRQRFTMKSKQLSEFCKELAVMLRSGLPMVKALQIISMGQAAKKVTAVYVELHRLLKTGLSLSEAMKTLGRVFPELMINMFYSGEVSGTMAEVAEKMTVYYHSDYKLRKKISQSTVYPRILAVLTTVALVAIFAFVLPSILDMIGDAPLPGITRFVKGISDVVVYQWYNVLIAAFVIIAVFMYLRTVTVFKYGYHKLFVRLPKISPLLKTIYTARFARTLASLYGSGIQLVTAIGVSSKIIGNLYIEGQFPELLRKVKQGEPLSRVIGQTEGFTQKLENIIVIGEETGKLDDILDFAAESLEYDADVAISSLLAMLEPVMLIVMAVVIGTVIIAALLPIFQMYSAVETM